MNISITRDEEASVWIAECEDAGLILEAESYDELINTTKCALPDLIELNQLPVNTVFVITTENQQSGI